YLNADANRRRAEGAEASWRTAADEARAGEEKARQSEAETKAVLTFFNKRILGAAQPKGQGNPKGQGQGLGREATIRAAVDAAEPGIPAAFVQQPLAEASIREALGFTY